MSFASGGDAIILSGNGSVSATVNSERQVKISGKVISDLPLVSIMVLDPNGNVDYAGFVEAEESGVFSITYVTECKEAGRYKVAIRALDFSMPVCAYFMYDPVNNELESLKIAEVSISPSFESGKTENSAEVPNDIQKIK